MFTKSSNVQVSIDQKGWKFPTDHPTVKSEDGTKEYYTIPVTYHLLDTADSAMTLEAIIMRYRNYGITDPLAEFNAGVKLAFGDQAKAPYRVEGGVKLFNVALQWIVEQDDLTLLKEYQTMQKADKANGTSLAKEWLLEAFRTKDQ